MTTAAPRSLLRSIGRRATAPFRNYFNQHFEQTKAEVRAAAATQAPPTRALDATDVEAVVELAEVVAESESAQTRVIARLRDDVDELRTEVVGLREEIARVTAAIAALTDRSIDER